MPSQLTPPLVPGPARLGGAMVLLIASVWRRESHAHQRLIGVAAIVLCGVTMLLALNWANRYTATPGPIAIDNFRWLMDVVILLGTIFAIALSMDDNMRSGI